MSTASNKLQSKLKAFANSERLQILQLLAKGRLNVTELSEALDKSQPALSHDLQTLMNAELIIQQREGRFNFYSLNPELSNTTDNKTSIDLGVCSVNFASEVKKEKKKAKKSA